MKPFRIYTVTKTEQLALSISPAPPGGRDLHESIKLLVNSGVELICSLLSLPEIKDLGLKDMNDQCVENGIIFYHLPIDDFGCPIEDSHNHSLLKDLFEKYSNGIHVHFHCKMGIGRSGMMAIYMLLKNGMPLQSAIDLVSEKRGIKTPESIAQINWLKSSVK